MTSVICSSLPSRGVRVSISTRPTSMDSPGDQHWRASRAGVGRAKRRRRPSPLCIVAFRLARGVGVASRSPTDGSAPIPAGSDVPPLPQSSGDPDREPVEIWAESFVIAGCGRTLQSWAVQVGQNRPGRAGRTGSTWRSTHPASVSLMRPPAGPDRGCGGGPVMAGRRRRRVRRRGAAGHPDRGVAVGPLARPQPALVGAALGAARRRPRPGPRRRRPPADRPTRAGVDQHQAPPHRQALPRRRPARAQRPTHRLRPEGAP